MKGSVPLDKIVLDTNNIISLFLKGDFEYFSHLKFKYKIEVCASLFQIDELRDVLTRPESYFVKYLKLPVEEYIDFFKRHSVIYDLDLSYEGIEDSMDNFLVDTAYAAKAFYIISGDRKVLAKKHVKRIQIISITQFNKKLKDRLPSTKL